MPGRGSKTFIDTIKCEADVKSRKPSEEKSFPPSQPSYMVYHMDFYRPRRFQALKLKLFPTIKRFENEKGNFPHLREVKQLLSWRNAQGLLSRFMCYPGDANENWF